MMTGFVPRLVSERSEVGEKINVFPLFHPGLKGASFEPDRLEIK